jgi:ADP-heptose:LPS heptosyltransferase
MALSHLRPLGAVEGVACYGLQVGDAASQSVPPGLDLIFLGASFEDFADAAAAIANLDLVITVDTAIAHLAGALGQTVWTLLPFAPDWRWMLDRADSPWYPTMRLYRQPAPGDWESVVERVVADLTAMARR